jgi:ankyrin repeat protein
LNSQQDLLSLAKERSIALEAYFPTLKTEADGWRLADHSQTTHEEAVEDSSAISSSKLLDRFIARHGITKPYHREPGSRKNVVFATPRPAEFERLVDESRESLHHELRAQAAKDDATLKAELMLTTDKELNDYKFNLQTSIRMMDDIAESGRFNSTHGAWRIPIVYKTKNGMLIKDVLAITYDALTDTKYMILSRTKPDGAPQSDLEDSLETEDKDLAQNLIISGADVSGINIWKVLDIEEAKALLASHKDDVHASFKDEVEFRTKLLVNAKVQYVFFLNDIRRTSDDRYAGPDVSKCDGGTVNSLVGSLNDISVLVDVKNIRNEHLKQEAEGQLSDRVLAQYRRTPTDTALIKSLVTWRITGIPPVAIVTQHSDAIKADFIKQFDKYFDKQQSYLEGLEDWRSNDRTQKSLAQNLAAAKMGKELAVVTDAIDLSQHYTPQEYAEMVLSRKVPLVTRVGDTYRPTLSHLGETNPAFYTAVHDTLVAKSGQAYEVFLLYIAPDREAVRQSFINHPDLSFNLMVKNRVDDVLMTDWIHRNKDNLSQQRKDEILRFASECGNIKVCTAALSIGANSAHYSYGTALNLAMAKGEFDLATVLLQHMTPAQINVPHNGKTALDIALAVRHKNLAIALIKSGASVTPEQGEKLLISGYVGDKWSEPLLASNEAVDILTAMPNKVDMSFKNAALRASCDYYTIIELSQAAIASGADILKVSGYKTKEELMRWGMRSNNHVFILAAVDLGMDVNEVVRDDENNTPLHKFGSGEEYVRALFTRGAGASLNKQNNWGGIPLHVAASSIHGSNEERKVNFEALKFLIPKYIEAGIGLDMRNKCGETALFHAAYCMYGSWAVDDLIAGGCDVNVLNEQQANALHKAAADGHPDSIKSLIKAGINVNQVTKIGYTPLGAFLTGGNLRDRRGKSAEAMALLLGAGADISNASRSIDAEYVWGYIGLPLARKVLENPESKPHESFLNTVLAKARAVDHATAIEFERLISTCRAHQEGMHR